MVKKKTAITNANASGTARRTLRKASNAIKAVSERIGSREARELTGITQARLVYMRTTDPKSVGARKSAKNGRYTFDAGKLTSALKAFTKSER